MQRHAIKTANRTLENLHAELRNKKEISVPYCVLRHESLLKSGNGPASKNGNKHVKWRQPHSTVLALRASGKGRILAPLTE